MVQEHLRTLRAMQVHARNAGAMALLFVLAACHGTGSADPLAPALWQSGTVASGTESIEVRVVLQRAGTVEWALYQEPHPGLTASEVRSGTGDTIRTGSIEVTTGDVSDTVRALISGLTAETEYHVYLAGTAADAEPVPDDHDVVHAIAATLAPRQPAFTIQSTTVGASVGYYVYLPESHFLVPGEKLPLLVFLHGSGEKGNGTTELSRVLVHGPPKLVRAGRDFPFVVVSPQLPSSQGGWPAGLVGEVIDRAVASYNIDTTRIYLTGLSLGGFGTWGFATARPARIAAIVPIAGGGNPGQVCAMRPVPVWGFHGDADGTVNVSGSVNTVNALAACTPAPAVTPRLTIYPGVGHDSWSRTYDGSAGHDIYAWLLTHHK